MAATISSLVIALAIMISLFVFGQRTMGVLRPVFRALGISAVFARLTRGLGGGGQVSYVWWRLAGGLVRTSTRPT